MEKYNINELIPLAVKILKNETEYISDRQVIDEIFASTKQNFSVGSIKIRLTIIDSMYSTNMSKRLFGITDLSESIFNIGDDTIVLKELDKFKNNDKESKIDFLINDTYGIRKDTTPFGEARSLISKYLYFLSGHNFPIEDSLVKDNINKVLKYFYNSKIDKKKDFLHELTDFCIKNTLQFDQFDNFMWLLGKISKGSLSLLSNKNTYLQIINKLNIQETESKKINKEISKNILKDKYLQLIKDYISDDLFNFILFLKTFKNFK